MRTFPRIANNAFREVGEILVTRPSFSHFSILQEDFVGTQISGLKMDKYDNFYYYLLEPSCMINIFYGNHHQNRQVLINPNIIWFSEDMRSLWNGKGSFLIIEIKKIGNSQKSNFDKKAFRVKNEISKSSCPLLRV